MFFDGFGAMGFRRSTTAVKATLLGGGKSPVRTLMEWRGDEAGILKWLPTLEKLIGNQRLRVDYVIVDQKCAIYLLKTRGCAAEDCFIFSKEVTRTVWKDISMGASGCKEALWFCSLF